MERVPVGGKWLKVTQEGSERAQYINLSHVTLIVMMTDHRGGSTLYVDDTEVYATNVPQADIDAALLSDGQAVLHLRKAQ